MFRTSFFAAALFVSSFAQAQENSFALKPEALAGDWTLSDINPSGGCRITLEVSNSSFGYAAYVFGCTADDVTQVTGWRLRGTSIVLTDNKSAQVVLLKIMDRNRFKGRSSSGRSIVLSR
jgi:hypothetical protein